jgi:hypothetical protein
VTGETADAREFLSWILTAARGGSPSRLLTTLLSDARLELGDPGHTRCADEIDEILGRLAALAKGKRTPVIVVLPDSEPTRAAAMLGTLLLDFWWDRHQAGASAGQPVLYFGNDIGIREDLGAVTVRDLGAQLSETLPQAHLARRSGSALGGRRIARRLGLPSLLTVYAPADPEDLVRRYSPPFVVADLGITTDVPWLERLVAETRSRGIPTIMWATNPWPVGRQLGGTDPVVISLPRLGRGGPAGAPKFATTAVQPVVLGDDNSRAIGRALRAAAVALARSSTPRAANGARDSSGVTGDAVALHWRMLRSIELMPCPVNFHEALANSYWGLTPMSELAAACVRFRDAAQASDPTATAALTEAAAEMDEALVLLASGNPMWDALAQLAVDSDSAGLDVVFGTRARRNLFLDAMLSIYSITVEDLRSVGVEALSLAEIQAMPPSDWIASPRQTVCVGTFAGSQDRYLESLMAREGVRVLIYEHELSRLEAGIRRWASARSFDAAALGRLVPLGGPSPPRVPLRATLSDPVVLQGTAAAGDREAAKVAWREVDAEDELARFLEIADVAQKLDVPEDDPWVGADEGGRSEGEGVILDTALRVVFDEGWFAMYAPDDQLMFLRGLGKRVHTESRPAAELYPGCEILAIHGQRRQSLYGVLVERLHRNPVIALQLALIREWHHELATKYRVWSDATGRSVDDLVGELQARGSRITSALAVRFWIAGQTLAPLDPADIRRVAEVLSMEFTLRRHREIAAAAARLRGLHRGISNRITNWLEREAGSVARLEESPIDPALGVEFSDFANTLVRLKVQSVERSNGPFLRSRLGFLERS